MLPGGRSGGGSEKIVPICACAGVAAVSAVAAKSAARPVRVNVRNISRGFNSESGLLDILQGIPPLAGHPVNTANTAGEGRHPCPSRPGLARSAPGWDSRALLSGVRRALPPKTTCNEQSETRKVAPPCPL